MRRRVVAWSPSKYRVAPSEERVYRGVLYASKAEAKRAAELDVLVRVGEVAWWIGQPLFRLGVPENTYRPDFEVVPVNGAVRVEDVKGWETTAFRRIRKLWEAYGPCELWVIHRDGLEVVVGGAMRPEGKREGVR
jgi:hypothetical protein